MTKEINENFNHRVEACRNEGTYAKEYKSLNKEVSLLVTEVKREIWQRKVLVAKGRSDM